MDAVFKALADPTRRALLDALRQRDGQTLSELQAAAEMSRFGVMKHLAQLEEAGLVTTVKRGRFKHHYLNAVPLQQAIDRYIGPLAKPAARALIDLKTRLETGLLDSDDAPSFVHVIFIGAPPEIVWAALTDGRVTPHYYFGTRLSGQLRPGRDYAYLGEDGAAILTGRVLAADPPRRLEMTFHPSWVEGGPSRNVFRVDPDGAQTRLTIEHYDLPPEQAGIREGWARIASALKSHLETTTQKETTT